MNRKLMFVTAISLIGFSAIFYLLNKGKSNHSSHYPMAIGDKKDKNARLTWELMRLQDPATGKIPRGIRAKELKFAKELPKANDETSRFANWTAMGPYNIGGRTRAMAIDVTDENVLLAGGISGGLWRTADGGQSWSKVTSPDHHQSITTIAQDTRQGKENVWYYGTGEGFGASASGGGAYYLGDGLFKSIDGGTTWNPISVTSFNSPQSFNSNWEIVWRVATDPSTDTADVVYAATYGAVYRSFDSGDTWNLIKGGAAYFTDVAVTSSGVTYATMSSDGSQRGIWRLPGYLDWADITPDSFPTTYDRIVIGIAPSNENITYFLAHTPGGGKMTEVFFDGTEWNSLWKYEYVSGDGTGSGGIWTDLSANIPENGNVFDNFNAQGSYNLVVKVKPDDPNTVFIGGTNLYRSTDGFATSGNTTQIAGYSPGSTLPFFSSYPNQHPDHHWVAFMPSNPNVLISSNDGGVWKTTDCAASNVVWESLNNGYYTSQAYTVGIDHGTPGSREIVAGFQDYGTWWTNSWDPQKAWTFPQNGDGSHLAIVDGSGTYYFSRQRGKVIKMTLDANGEAADYRRIDPITGDTAGGTYLFINPFILDPNDNNIMYLAEGNRLWRNDDLNNIALTNEWDSISQGWFRFADSLPVQSMNITTLAASTAPAYRLYFGTDNRRVYRVDNANTGSPTFTDITGLWSSAYVNCVAIDPRDADKVLVVFSNYNIYSLFYSEDGGSNWIKVAGNLEQVPGGSGNGPSCRWAEIIPLDDGGTVYLLGTSTGLYATDSMIADSTVWVQQAANEIGTVVVDMIDTRGSDGFTAVGTHGNGIFTSYISHFWDITGNDELKMMNDELRIYPNPASNWANIEFELTAEGDVSIEIFDATGRKAMNDLRHKMGEGRQVIPINTQNLANGIYYCTLSANHSSITKKLLVSH
ncbi:MAG: flagellar basal body rod modification protein [Flavobacteriales bacterium]|nr:MAG: flagellar basal body rod modification protein [Flavobacteriales bacterium]